MNYGREFDTFQHFKIEFEKWNEKTKTKWIINRSKTLNNLYKHNSHHYKIDVDKFQYKSIMFVCVHFGLAKSKSSTLRRPQQR